MNNILFFEALEKSSPELKEKYWFAKEFIWNLYYYGEIDFLFEIYPINEQNRLTLFKKILNDVNQAFIEQYQIENI